MANPRWFENVEQRPHPWPGLNWLTSSICAPDVRKALAFYTEIMQMVSIFELEDDHGDLLFARVRYRGNNFIISREGWDSDARSPASSKQTPAFLFYLYVDDVRGLVEAMRAAGANVLAEPEQQFWGDLKARVADPLGYHWDIAQKL